MTILTKLKEFAVGGRKSGKKCPKCGCTMHGNNHKCKAKYLKKKRKNKKGQG